MSDLQLQAPVPLPRPGQQRAWWRAPASGTALAAAALAAAQRFDGPLLLVARDNHAAHQLEADLRTLTGGDPALMARNLKRLEEAAWPIFAAGHVPMIGEWVALPVLAIKIKGALHVTGRNPPG